MGKLVQVNVGFMQVSLPPNGLPFNAGQTTTLTDAEYAALTTSTTRAISVTGNPADPVRTPTAAPVSLSDALAQAKTYADGKAGLPASASAFVARVGTNIFSTFYAGPTPFSAYIIQVNIPQAGTITGISLVNGDAIGSNVRVALYDYTGALLAQSAASTAQSAINTRQSVPFTAPYAVQPGAYYLALVQDTSTGHLVVGTVFEPCAVVAQGSFIVPASITPLTTTANGSPVPALSTY